MTFSPILKKNPNLKKRKKITTHTTNATWQSYNPTTYTTLLGGVAFKSSYVYELFPVPTIMAIFSRTRIPLAILMHEQFIHLTQITLRPNIQLLSNPQHAYQSFFVLLSAFTPFAILRQAANML